MKITAYFDGSCGPPNPGGPAGFGAVIFAGNQKVWECSEVFIPPKKFNTSSNVAEYLALIAILKWCLANKKFIDKIYVYGDSELVIRQMFGDWKIHNGFYDNYARFAKKLISKIPNIEGSWIPREKNNMADRLSRKKLKKLW